MINLYNGDCLEVMDKLISDGVMVDLIVTSPPYNMRTRVRNGKYTTREKSEHFSKKYDNFHDALSIEDYYTFHKNTLEKMMELSRIVLWNIQIVTGSKEAVFKLIGHFNKEIKDIIIWDKGHGQPAMHSGVLNRGSELIIIFEKDASAGRGFRHYNFERGELQDIWRIKRSKHIKGHGATFPVELAKCAVKNFSPPNGVVLDPFMGSGTTGVACKNLNRNFIGIELDETYFNIAKQRIESVEKQKELF